MQVTIWFDYCGHFTNKVYVFSSIGELPSTLNSQEIFNSLATKPLNAQNYLAFLKFSEVFHLKKFLEILKILRNLKFLNRNFVSTTKKVSPYALCYQIYSVVK